MDDLVGAFGQLESPARLETPILRTIDLPVQPILAVPATNSPTAASLVQVPAPSSSILATNTGPLETTGKSPKYIRRFCIARPASEEKVHQIAAPAQTSLANPNISASEPSAGITSATQARKPSDQVSEPSGSQPQALRKESQGDVHNFREARLEATGDEIVPARERKLSGKFESKIIDASVAARPRRVSENIGPKNESQEELRTGIEGTGEQIESATKDRDCGASISATGGQDGSRDGGGEQEIRTGNATDEKSSIPDDTSEGSEEPAWGVPELNGFQAVDPNGYVPPLIAADDEEEPAEERFDQEFSGEIAVPPAETNINGTPDAMESASEEEKFAQRAQIIQQQAATTDALIQDLLHALKTKHSQLEIAQNNLQDLEIENERLRAACKQTDPRPAPRPAHKPTYAGMFSKPKSAAILNRPSPTQQSPGAILSSWLPEKNAINVNADGHRIDLPRNASKEDRMQEVREYARNRRCGNGGRCRDASCVYGHICPVGRHCPSGPRCKFADTHFLDRKITRIFT